MTNPFAHLDALAQAELVRSGEVAPDALVDAALSAMDDTNGATNAVIHRRDVAARSEASLVRPGDQPLAGVPIVVKDLDGTLAGEPYHAGSEHLKRHRYVATDTSWLFSRLTEAGCVIVGKSNTPELGLIPSTEPVAFGPTHNPWDPTRSPGGSSGGSAAAVASGVVPVGHAGDGGGSIRIPAAMCGLVGLKPSRGRVSLGPVETVGWDGLVQRLAVTRTVRDTAAVLDIVSGPRTGDPYWAAPPERRYADEVGAPVETLRIGWTAEAGDGSTVEPEVRDTVLAAVALLDGLGHRVGPAEGAPSSDAALVEEMTTHFLGAWPVWTAQSLDQFQRWTGVAPSPDTVEAHTWALAELGRATTGPAFGASVEGLRQLSRRVVSWWDDADILVTPTVGGLAPVLGRFGPEPENSLAGVFAASWIVAFTVAFNITGQPAISLPLGQSSSGVPIGVQLVAAPGRDDVLIRLAAQIEAAAPWAERRPQVWAG